MGLLDFLKSNTVEAVGSIVDNVFTNDEEKSTAKKQLTEVVLKSLNDVAKVQGEVIKAELSGNFLQRSWRPILMLTFAGICVISVFYDVKLNNVPAEFWNLLKIGIGGYVGGRTIEKVTDNVTKNVDISFLKKKNRNK